MEEGALDFPDINGFHGGHPCCFPLTIRLREFPPPGALWFYFPSDPGVLPGFNRIP